VTATGRQKVLHGIITAEPYLKFNLAEAQQTPTSHQCSPALQVPTALQQSIQRLSPIMANHLHTQHDDGPSPATSSGASINSVTAEHVPIEAQTYRGSASFQV
jgi:hypothetical protein